MKNSIKKDKKVKVKKEKVVMVSYEMKMVIPTAQYANIQPCIIVKGGTMEEAHAYVAPHMNKLWKEYFMVSERPEILKKVDPMVQPTAKTLEKAPEAQKMTATVISTPSPASSVALNKATQAIASCTSLDALNLISVQVEKSVKLNDEDKISLRVLINEKAKTWGNEK